MTKQKNKIQFTKMHGLGNDFVVIDTISQALDIGALPIKQLAHRYLGIGFDQLLLIKPSHAADFYCQIYNADGSEAEQCGNGLRCVARYAYDKHLTPEPIFTIETKAGLFPARMLENRFVQITMGIPVFEPENIPFLTENLGKNYELILESSAEALSVSVLSMGNPHVVMQVPSVEYVPVVELGTRIAQHAAFPQGTNVGFMEIVDRQHIRLRTLERGAGETFACGSNSCAAVVAGINNGLLDHTVEVELLFGSLWVEWQGENHAVVMTGPAEFVFEGVF
jgi:diaminopimelate epimerase